MPPSAFPGGLQPATSGANRRISRTDMDFEQALRSEGTVKLAEGFDVNSLGVETSPSPSPRGFSSKPTPPAKNARTPRTRQPPTPVVVPPTPGTPAVAASSARLAAPSPSSSSGDIFYDAEDIDVQTKRRSLYRSPGTSSSPDLATLLRKAKERGGTVSSHHKKDKRPEPPPPPLPTAGLGFRGPDCTPATRQRSSTSSSPAPPPNLQTNFDADNGGVRSSNSTDDWVFTSPRSRTASRGDGGDKNKKTVRSKTSAFLGKMWGGQGSVRERSGTDASSQSTPSTPLNRKPSFMEAFVPPVPPLPQDISPANGNSPIADIFTTHRGTSNTTKPLPPIQPSMSHSPSEESLVLIEQQSPLKIKSRFSVPSGNELALPEKPSNHVKRRSMSVGEIDLIKAMTESASTTPLPLSKTPQKPKADVGGWDTTLDGMLKDFKGELSQLEPFSSNSLELRDPSTPARRTGLGRSQTDGLVFPHTAHQERNTPTVTLQRAPLLDDDARRSSSSSRARSSTSTEGAMVGRARSPSLTPTRSASGASGSSQVSSPRGAQLKYTPSQQRSRNGFLQGNHAHSASRDQARMRMHHRSTASSSEPSLIPIGDDIRVRPFTASSQQDLTSARDIYRRASRDDDVVDMEAKGKEMASRCFAEDEDFLAKEKIAEWLGGHLAINKIALQYYIDFFGFTGLRLDHAFRRLCAKLYLKAETQQVDRILEAFSRRYWECNPATPYGSASLVHAVSYSLLLLNTDLHVADLATRMSKSQFVRNTMSAIQSQVSPNRDRKNSGSDLFVDDGAIGRGNENNTDGQDTTVTGRSKRSGSIASYNSGSRDPFRTSLPPGSATGSGTQVSSYTPVEGSSLNGSSTSLFDSKPPNSSATSIVYNRSWEIDMENLLKEMYNAIKSQQILQPLGSTMGARASTSSLSPGGGMIRNRSGRQQQQPDRLTTLKRGSIRGLQSIMGGQTNSSPYSSNSSVDGRASPSPSFATSMHDGHAAHFLTPTLGFASNLSHTIIRETQEDDDRSIRSDDTGATNISITDEELALLGAPWAKEGMLCRKQYWESAGKRSKDKAWMDVFVVIQKGELNMFTFGDYGGGGSGVVGGGNWLDNANSVGMIELAHSLAHALPPPGYNRQRPHCMVLTLSNGGVYFLQAGTEELVNEWVSTCNYWAARTSKEPLAGGVSNMEYGWNRVQEQLPHERSTSQDTAMDVDRTDSLSVRSGRSIRNKMWKDKSDTMRGQPSPYADKIYINDWKAPLPPTVSSVHDEESQMDALQKHVASMKRDLQRHNELRQPMSTIYPPRSSNAMKSLSNWEKKSQYLLTETVKYDSYIESLRAAMTLRLKKRGEKALERALVVSSPEDDAVNAVAKWKGYPDEDTIAEAEEPPTTPGAGPNNHLTPMFHRREAGSG